MTITRSGVLAIVAAACAVLASPFAYAQGYPARQIRFVVPYPPGGPTDLMARTVSGKLGEALGQSVVVDNRPGAGGNVGAEMVARSAPDGYTMLMGAISTHSINISLYRNLPFHPVKDFAPVTQVSWIPLALCANPSLQANNVAELIALAKAQPGKLAYGSSGNGGGTHLAGELFKTMTGTDFIHVPYKGLNPATVDLLAGSIPTMWNDLTTALPHYRSGKLKILAVSTASRVAQLPDVRTVAETVPGYEAYTWFAMYFPAGTPADIVQRMNRETVRILQSEETRRKFAEFGAEPVGGTSTQLAEFMQSEIAKWAKVIRESGAKVD
ncbi:MAG: tripartite tricarboxylate transporter substrate binding protein [Betaproteobacteria bacterium]|nr:tripartite tricarboxylate transporter substrate binding protein [Betaproteobacteria bacterium]